MPEPDLEEIHIGDVGYTWQGSFCSLFNATLPAFDPINRNGVPRSFVPITFDRERLVRVRDAYLPDGPICSRTVRHLKLSTSAEVT